MTSTTIGITTNGGINIVPSGSGSIIPNGPCTIPNGAAQTATGTNIIIGTIQTRFEMGRGASPGLEAGLEAMA